MSFVSVLRKDFNVFVRCINFQLLNGAKIRNSPTRRTDIFYRYCSETQNRTIPKPIGDKTVIRLKQFDRIPKDFVLIYRAPRSSTFALAQGTLLVCGISIPVMLFTIAERNDFKFPIRVADQFILHSLLQLIVVVVASTCILGVMFLLVSRFPLRLYYKKSTNDYIATYANLVLPWKMDKFSFKKGEVTRIPDKEMLPYQMSNYKIKGHKNIFLEDYFIRPADLEHMLEYR